MNTLKMTILASLLMTFASTSYAQLSKERWADIIIKKDTAWYRTREAFEVAENVLLYQRNIGGWPKNIQMHQVLSDADKEKLANAKTETKDLTTDNKATTQEMLFLSKMYSKIHDQRYEAAFLKGLDYILSAQYQTNGGWPQFFPLRKGYYTHITYNDDSMYYIMNMLKELVEESEVYSIKPNKATLSKAKIAFDKGIQCILKTQYRQQNGTLTVWCQQHDEVTLAPASARAYELPSLSGRESVRLTLLLMTLKNPSPEVITAVNAAAAFFEKTKITGLREERVPIPGNTKNMDKVMINDPNSTTPLWARFMDLETNVPFFCDRDGVKKATLAELGQERRIGYSWYAEFPREIARRYPKWKRKYNVK